MHAQLVVFLPHSVLHDQWYFYPTRQCSNSAIFAPLGVTQIVIFCLTWHCTINGISASLVALKQWSFCRTWHYTINSIFAPPNDAQPMVFQLHLAVHYQCIFCPTQWCSIRYSVPHTSGIFAPLQLCYASCINIHNNSMSTSFMPIYKFITMPEQELIINQKHYQVQDTFYHATHQPFKEHSSQFNLILTYHSMTITILANTNRWITIFRDTNIYWRL